MTRIPEISWSHFMEIEIYIILLLTLNTITIWAWIIDVEMNISPKATIKRTPHFFNAWVDKRIHEQHERGEKPISQSEMKKEKFLCFQLNYDQQDFWSRFSSIMLVISISWKSCIRAIFIFRINTDLSGEMCKTYAMQYAVREDALQVFENSFQMKVLKGGLLFPFCC